MKGPAVMDDGATGRQRAIHRLPCIEPAQALQRHDAGIISRRSVRQHRSAMTARNIAQTSVHDRRLLQRHPDAYLLVVDPDVMAMGIVLVPGGGTAVESGLEDGVLEPWFRPLAQQLKRHGLSPSPVVNGQQLGCELRWIK
jgi:hypothetical protein